VAARLMTLCCSPQALLAQERYDEAEGLLNRALTTCEAVGGLAHEDTVAAAANLVDCLDLQGDRAAQEVLLSSLAYRRERELGASHALVADALQQLGWCQHAQFKYAEAEANLSKALRMQEEELGREHPSTGETLWRCGWVLVAQRELGSALTYLTRGLAIRDKALADTDDAELAESHLQLGQLLHGQLGQAAPAEPHLRRAAAVYSQLTASGEILLFFKKATLLSRK
jgi:tetratricopeptide (TPR) repeat protein